MQALLHWPNVTFHTLPSRFELLPAARRARSPTVRTWRAASTCETVRSRGAAESGGKRGAMPVDERADLHELLHALRCLPQHGVGARVRRKQRH